MFLILIGDVVIGHTNVLLEASRKEECNLGNLIADSMVHWVIIILNTNTHLPKTGKTILYA